MLVKQTLPFHTLNISYSPNYLLNNQLESDFHGQLIIQGKKKDNAHVNVWTCYRRGGGICTVRLPLICLQYVFSFKILHSSFTSGIVDFLTH